VIHNNIDILSKNTGILRRNIDILHKNTGIPGNNIDIFRRNIDILSKNTGILSRNIGIPENIFDKTGQFDAIILNIILIFVVCKTIVNFDIKKSKNISIMANYLPTKETELAVWLSNFVTVANANLVALGLVAADLTPVSTLQPTFTANINDVEAKKAALASAIDTKDATKELVIQKVRVVVNRIQANPAVTVALKSQLGISTKDGGSVPQHPLAPNQLVAELLPDGSIELDWNRNGNGPGTQFVIEYRALPSANWQLLNVITKTSYIHSGLAIGAGIEYRIKARKGNETSVPCNTAVIHAGAELSGGV
jgi:hypothetical protein